MIRLAWHGESASGGKRHSRGRAFEPESEPPAIDPARRRWRGLPALLACVIVTTFGSSLRAQTDPPIERPSPPALEDFEQVDDSSTLPDGWYNARDARLVDGGVVGARCLRFENDRHGRPARASRAFGVDGRAFDTMLIGLWVKADSIQAGERLGEEPSMILGFFDEELRPVAQRSMGPWTDRSVGTGWVRVASRVPVPPGSRDVILTLGLFGATGTLDVDGLTIELLPRGGEPTTNLILNGDFELGDPSPNSWELAGEARRVFPGHESDTCLELASVNARAEAGIAIPVDRLQALEIRLNARASSLRATGGALADVLYLDRNGRPLQGTTRGLPRLRWAGTFDWRAFRETVQVPPAASWAVLRFQKSASGGRLLIDDVQVTAAPNAAAGSWTPYQVVDETAAWAPYLATEAIEAGSALDASSLVPAPAGSVGRVRVDGGQLSFADGGPARFFGLSLLPPLAFSSGERAAALADRLARSGVNLVRLNAIDAPIGPGLGLLDDSREDTRALDPIAITRFDGLVDALKSRGIYVALDLQSQRRYRSGDDLPGYGGLNRGGGPAAAFDPRLRDRTLEAARLLLGRVNPKTALALRDDPVLAWVALAGELSLFDLIDQPDSLPPEFHAVLEERIQQGRLGAGRRAWQALESAQWREEAVALREFGLDAPIAGASHWRREPEFVASQSISDLDLIEDRLYWAPSRWSPSDRRSMLWDAGRTLLTDANRKRRAGRPYVVGEWASQTAGAWALPWEAADLMLVTSQAAANGWDAVVRRGVNAYPEVWGSAAPGTSGENDISVVPEAINAMPPAFALLPHAASLSLRRGDPAPRVLTAPGRLAIDSPHTQVLAGWAEGRAHSSGGADLESSSEFAVVAVSALGNAPVAEADRLLVTLVGRAIPSGLRWVDHWRREVADPGRPGILMEPVRARVTWKRRTAGDVRAFALGNDGSRGQALKVDTLPGGGVRVDLRGGATMHWELVATDD